MSYSIQSLIGSLSQDELARRADIINLNYLIGHDNTTSLLAGALTTLTFTPSAATTVLTFTPGILSATSLLTLQPMTANAAAAMNTWYVSSRNVLTGTLTLTHANNTQADRTFGYSLHG